MATAASDSAAAAATTEEPNESQPQQQQQKQPKSSPSQPDSTILVNQCVGNSEFLVGPYITGGAFGCIHSGVNQRTGEKVAIKVEHQDFANAQLHLEYYFYRVLGNMNFIPRMHFIGPCRNYNALVLDFLGPSLLKINQECGNRFSVVTTTKLMIQLLNIFEYVHSHGIIYRDIKPENFLLGPPDSDKWSKVHLIGFCKQYIDENNQHVPYREGKMVTGTIRYISINNHLNHELSRRDDLEAVLYMIVFLCKGSLPWQGLNVTDPRERNKQLMLIKSSTPAHELCSNMPVEYEQFMALIRRLKFEERPPYRHIMSQFQNILFRLGVTVDDEHYDWDRSQHCKPDNKRF